MARGRTRLQAPMILYVAEITERELQNCGASRYRSPPAQRAVSLRTLRTSACGGDVNLFCCTLRILDISFRNPSVQPTAAGGHNLRRSHAPFFDPTAGAAISYCEHCLFLVYYRNEKVTGG